MISANPHDLRAVEGVSAATISTLADRLEEDILFGKLRPRERLVEDELMERMGATRHAVRQALVDLQARHVVVRVPNKGAQVRDFSRAEIDEVCLMRDWLHERAARSIRVPAPVEWIDRLDALQKAHARAVELANPIDVHRTNNAFHDALFAGCGNRYLARTIHDYSQMSLAYRCHLMTRIDLAERARDEHRKMVRAIRRADIDALAALCVEHTRPSRMVYESLQGWEGRRPSR